MKRYANMRAAAAPLPDENIRNDNLTIQTCWRYYTCQTHLLMLEE